jgi:GT2 family glycosyltransferase
LQYYVHQYDSVRNDLKAGRARDAFAHLLLIGRAQGLRSAPVRDDEAEKEALGKAQFRLKAENLLPLLARQPIDFSCAEQPAVSVIVVMHNNFALTMLTLSSLRANYKADIDLILIDSGSTDQTRSITRFVRGAKVLRFDSNIGYVIGCNAALVALAAPAVLYLNNDVELLPDAVAAALRRLDSDPQIGAVGAKIIRMHGKLQEAGSIVWRDGVTLGYLRDASPLSPEANFVRDVDFCSAAFLMVRTELVRRLQGFGTGFAPAYYEDADLCARIIQTGLRVVYDPSVAIYHYEYGTAVSPLAVKQQIARSRQEFVRRNLGFLRERYDADPMTQIFARSRDTGQRRILFVEDQVPLRILGSGFVRSNDLIRVMAALGFHVTVFPIYGGRSDIIGLYSDMPDAVEVMCDRSLEDLPGFLASRDGYYDTIWIVRTHNLDRTCELLKHYVLRKEPAPRIILDTEAIAALRDDAQFTLNTTSDSFDLDAAIKQEFSNATLCRNIVVVNEREAEVLRKLDLKNVSVIGHARGVDPTERPFSDRSGMLFIGAIHAMNSPNYDSLLWFVDEVLPLVEQELGWETRLTIIGYLAEHMTLERFRNHSRITIHGPVEETRGQYDRHRVFIAPTRFGAGTPYKVFEAASFGLPVVASELLRRQLNVSEPVILSADVSDPALFADNIVRLHRDPVLWQNVRHAAIEWLQKENNMTDYYRAIGELLGPSRID